MKLYLVERTDSVSYDEYDSWVVAAKSPKEARKLCNWGVPIEEVRTRVTEIKPGVKARKILGSFNAG